MNQLWWKVIEQPLQIQAVSLLNSLALFRRPVFAAMEWGIGFHPNALTSHREGGRDGRLNESSQRCKHPALVQKVIHRAGRHNEEIRIRHEQRICELYPPPPLI